MFDPSPVEHEKARRVQTASIERIMGHEQNGWLVLVGVGDEDLVKFFLEWEDFGYIM